MVDILKVWHNKNEIGEIILNKDNGNFELRYNPNISIEDSISLTLPSTKLTYTEENFRLLPYFDMFIPEGYLFEVLKKIISKKEGKINDQIIFSYLSQGIEGRIKYKGGREIKLLKDLPQLSEVIENDSMDFFEYLVNLFLYKNSISGVQPKTFATLKEKGLVGLGEYIIKTFGKEYPYLTVNEYICLKIFEKAGIEVCQTQLSNNGNFLIIKRFDGSDTGFEEVCSILGKRKEEKYDGSYEKIAKIIYNFSNYPERDMETLFKILVLNYILGNGDAHLKNFGLIFSDNFSHIKISPAYDIVSTVAYIPNDLPALTLFGKKSWNEWKDIKQFAVKRCLISSSKLNIILKEIIDVVKDSYKLIDEYCKEFKGFKIFGKRMKKFIENSLKELKKEV